MSALAIWMPESYEQSMHLIAASCTCSDCCDNEPKTIEGANQCVSFCQSILVEFVIELVQIIPCISLPSPILPTRARIESLYWRRHPDIRLSDYVRALLDTHNYRILDSAKAIFTGRLRNELIHQPSAAVADGLYFFMDMLIEVSAEANKCKVVHVMPGRIEWKSASYSKIRDWVPNGPEGQKLEYNSVIGSSIPSPDCLGLPNSGSTALKLSFVVEEAGELRDTDYLAAAYRFERNDGRLFSEGPRYLSDRIENAVPQRTAEEDYADQCQLLRSRPSPARVKLSVKPSHKTST